MIEKPAIVDRARDPIATPFRPRPFFFFGFMKYKRTGIRCRGLERSLDVRWVLNVDLDEVERELVSKQSRERFAKGRQAEKRNAAMRQLMSICLDRAHSKLMDDVRDVRIEPCSESRYIRPYRLHYVQVKSESSKRGPHLHSSLRRTA